MKMIQTCLTTSRLVVRCVNCVQQPVKLLENGWAVGKWWAESSKHWVLLNTQTDAFSFPYSSVIQLMTRKPIEFNHIERLKSILNLNSLIAPRGGEEASCGVMSEDTQVYPSLVS